jgi:hypothetical protein
MDALRAAPLVHRLSFYEPGKFASASFCTSCIFMQLLTLFLALPHTVAHVLRIGPALYQIRWPAVLDDMEHIFPAGLELELDGGRVILRPETAAAAAAAAAAVPADADAEGSSIGSGGGGGGGGGGSGGGSLDGDVDEDEDFVCWSSNGGSEGWCATAPQLEPVLLRLPPLLHDAFYVDLPAPLPTPPARLVSFLLGARTLVRQSLAMDELLELGEGMLDPSVDDAPPIFEFEIGEIVEVQHGPSALLWRGGWRRAVIEGKHPAPDMAKYFYECRILASGGAEEAVEATARRDGGAGDQRGELVRKRSEQLRRLLPVVALVHDDYFRADLLAEARDAVDEWPPKALRAELLGLRAYAALMPTDVHMFGGYSFHYGQ